MKIRKTDVRVSTLLLLAVSSASYALNSKSSDVLVIDEGVDFDHIKLSSKARVNDLEKRGTVGRDDDQNGFVDDVAGWNEGSNNGSYFPARVKEMFTENEATVKELFELYSKVEMGDKAATDKLRACDECKQIVGFLMGLSHGTHVAGIISQQTGNESFMESFNVFTEDSPKPSSGISIASVRGNFGLRSTNAFTDNLKRKFNDLITEINETINPAAKPSIFDNYDELQKLVSQLEKSSAAEAVAKNKYLSAHPTGVINLSLGSSLKTITDAVNSMWVSELQSRNLPPETMRNEVQEANAKRLIADVLKIQGAGWENVVKSHPEILFVTAAGNDARVSNPEAGNNDKGPHFPSNLSVNYANVIAIAATDEKGNITDFSNFGRQTVNLGAPGKAVMSTAPGQNMVRMSGTSMAAPYVTGVASEMRQLNSRLNAFEIRKILERTGFIHATLVGRTTTGMMIDRTAALAAAMKIAGGMNIDAAIIEVLKSRDFLNRSSSPMFSPFLSVRPSNFKAETSDVVKDIMSRI